MIDIRDPDIKRLYKCSDETVNIPVYVMAKNPIDAHKKAKEWAESQGFESWQFNNINVMIGSFAG